MRPGRMPPPPRRGSADNYFHIRKRTGRDTTSFLTCVEDTLIELEYFMREVWDYNNEFEV